MPGSRSRSTGCTTPRSYRTPWRCFDRITRARTDAERVLVFGDFDADGLTGLTIMTLALRRFGVAVEPYVPSRLDEGHGLSLAAIEAAVASGSTVIVTVDCGSTSLAEIAIARERGLDVIVTDHHRVPPVLPDTVALVNPHRADSTYPDARLAGSGVAFKVAQLLLRDEPGGPAAALALADLATIGTVADVAPVVGENRAIARLGLERLRSAPRPGIAALLERARVAPAAVDLETVSFALAPRLNAAGRVGEAMEAARLLLAEDAAEASIHADALELANGERRDLMKAAVAEARALVADAPDAPATLVRGPWGVGIVGLVAARLAEDRGRAAVVGADLGDVVRASCRSDGTMDLGATLEQCGDLFIRYGGHAGAAGFEIATSRWDAARDPVPRARGRRRSRGSAGHPSHRPRPAGTGRGLCPLPRIRRPQPRRSGQPGSVGGGAGPDGHAGAGGDRRAHPADPQARAGCPRRQSPVGRADIAETVREGDRVDVVARLASRTFGGFESLQLEIRDVCPSGYHDGIRVVADPRELARPAAGRGSGMSQVRPKTRGVGDPFGAMPVGSWIAPVLSIVGLLLVLVVSLNLLGVDLKIGTPVTGGDGGNGGTVTRTPAPSNVVPARTRGRVRGFDRLCQGRQHLDPDRRRGPGVDDGRHGFDAVVVARWQDDLLHPDDAGDRGLAGPGPGSSLPDDHPEPDGHQGRWKRRAGAPPDRQVQEEGRHVVLLDAPARVVAERQDVRPRVGRPGPDQVRRGPPVLGPDHEEVVLSGGHRDPAFGPPGPGLAPRWEAAVLRPQRSRRGKGAPIIYRWDMVKKTSTPVTGPGYLEPSFSPDGKYIAATRINAFGSDVVILDAVRGRELLRLTTDGASWAPTWSPKGDAIAFFHIDGQIVDLKEVVLEGTAPNWTIAETKALTNVSGLDGSSRPDWFIPADELPATPAPTVPASASPSPGAAG